MGESSGLAVMPALTILAHPDVHRVGETAPLTALLDGREAKVDRDEPLFFWGDAESGRGLEHRAVSKKATSLVVAQRPDSGFELRPGDSNYPVELDSRPFDQPRAAGPRGSGPGARHHHQRADRPLPPSRALSGVPVARPRPSRSQRRDRGRQAKDPSRGGAPGNVRLAPRRDRCGQGADGAGDPRRERAVRGPLCRPQHGAALRHARRRRSVRPRARSLHRRQGQSGRRLRRGRWRNAVLGRDRGGAGRGSVQAASSARGRHHPAGGRRQAAGRSTCA